jgi:hypothetical protein
MYHLNGKTSQVKNAAYAEAKTPISTRYLTGKPATSFINVPIPLIVRR